jgi:cytochrome b6-f complex iron-sulfur subunit
MRRQRFLSFLVWGGLSALAQVLAACGAKGKANDGFARFASVLEMEESGPILRDYFAKDPILLIQDPTDKTQYHAVNATCSHQHCLVNWKSDRKAFVCPCHGSTFNTDGSVIQGPATAPLQTFPTRVQDKEIFVKA